MQDFEKLGSFYLGKQYDLAAGKVTDQLLLYDAKDLTTHAVCVGMTGSGKTGLCLALLEEAAIDGIPAICIDPKGDIGNLLLAFPQLQPQDFQPWVDPADAARKSMNVEQLAAHTADQWRKGLADWGQDGARIARFRDAVDLAIYTPGSSAGLPLTVLRSFNAPPAALIADADGFRERVNAAVSGLLALLGVDADPLRSREHILLASIFDRQWRERQNLSPADLIQLIQQPPFDKVGVIDLESFYPSKDRFALAMQLNNLIASPSFSAWMSGEPLDIQRLLFTESGKPRISILSIAHLSDAERMFFVTILLNEVVSWMRAQSGTSSLRALLYMDEIFGYFPPTANPPSKQPLLTLMKQARAFGLGVVVATQNPVDIDYKGLSNAGTWFLGRLQTERDKARVLEGLEGASVAAGSSFNRAKMEATLAGLGNRVFLMNNVHDDEPVVFQSRWALSYLRGPLTRLQIESLMKDRQGLQTTASPPGDATVSTLGTLGSDRPMLPPEVPQVFLTHRGSAKQGENVVYRPALLGSAKVHFASATAAVDTWRDISLLVDGEDVGDAPWDNADRLPELPEVGDQALAAARFAELPGPFSRAKQYSAWNTALKDHIYRNEGLTLWRSKELKQTSQPGESEGDFRARLAQHARELRDERAEKLRAKYATRLATAQEQVRKAMQRVEKEKSQASEQTFAAAVSFGASILGAFTGRKLASATNIGRAATSARAASRVARERADIGQAEETVEASQQKLAKLQADFQAELDSVELTSHAESLVLECVEIKPKKSDITITRLALAWVPYRVASDGIATRMT